MENTINELLQLAEKYAAFAKEHKFPETHTYLQYNFGDAIVRIADDSTDILISVYLSEDIDWWKVTLGETEITSWANKIAIPYPIDKDYLIDVIKQATVFFDDVLPTLLDKIINYKIESTNQRIVNLEKQIAKLKEE